MRNCPMTQVDDPIPAKPSRCVASPVVTDLPAPQHEDIVCVPAAACTGQGRYLHITSSSCYALITDVPVPDSSSLPFAY